MQASEHVLQIVLFALLDSVVCRFSDVLYAKSLCISVAFKNSFNTEGCVSINFVKNDSPGQLWTSQSDWSRNAHEDSQTATLSHDLPHYQQTLSVNNSESDK